MNSLSKKIFRGFGWIALVRYSNRILGFLTVLILAKLLSPEDFGLVALAGIVIEILYIFKDMGFSQALIHRKEQIKEASDTAFFLILIFYSALFAFAVIISPLVADFYDNPTVTPILIVASSNLIWTGLRAIPTALITKELEFNKFLIPEVVPALVGSVIGIGMAFIGYGVWSLVVRSLITNMLGMISLFKLSNFKPSLRFNRKIAAELLGYGKYIIGASIFTVALYNIDQFYVSKFGGIVLLGVYSFAMNIANMPVTEFGHIICRVMFPVFSKLNDEKGEMRSVFLKTFGYMNLLLVPIVMGIVFFGPALINSVYGEKWIEAILPLQILSIYAFFRALSGIIYEFFKASGQPELMQRFVIIRFLLVGLFGIPALYYYDLKGLCALIAGVYWIVFMLELRRICQMLRIKQEELIKCIISPLILAVLVIPGIYLLLEKIFLFQEKYTLAVGIPITITLYLGSLFFLKKEIVVDIRKIINLVDK